MSRTRGLRVPGDNTVVKPHILCQRCNEICQKSTLLRTTPIQYEAGHLEINLVEDLGKKVEECFHHSTFEELEATHSSCHLCTMIWHVLDDFNELEILRGSIWRPRNEEEDRLILVIKDDKFFDECAVAFKFGRLDLRAGLRILSASGKHTTLPFIEGIMLTLSRQQISQRKYPIQCPTSHFHGFGSNFGSCKILDPPMHLESWQMQCGSTFRPAYSINRHWRRTGGAFSANLHA
jgi:hypothetical protein